MSSNPSTAQWREKLAAEHKQLRTLLGDAARTFAQRREAVKEAARTLAAVSEEVREHFQDEEKEDGFYEQIVEQAPRLLGRADELRAEHAGFRQSVVKLTETLRRVHDYESWWEKLEQGFHQFSADLMRHESDECELLQDAYEEDIGSED